MFHPIVRLRSSFVAWFLVLVTLISTAPALLAQATEVPTEVPPTSVPTEVPPTSIPTEVPPTSIPTEVPPATTVPTEVPATLTINGSEAPSIVTVSTDRIAFNASSGWIAFFSDSTCITYLGSVESPSDDLASAYEGIWGSAFHVAGATRTGTPTTSCRSVHIEAPMFLYINNSQDLEVYLDGDNIPVMIGLPVGPSGYTLWIYQEPACVNGAGQPYRGGNTIVSPEEAHNWSTHGYPASAWLRAERTSDGAKTSCRMLGYNSNEAEPGSVTPTATVPLDPTTSPNGQPTSTLTPTTTDPITVAQLPSTGDGGNSTSAMPVLLLGAALTLLAISAGITRRQRHGS